MSSGYPLRDAAGPSQSHHPYSESESPPRQVPSPNNYSGSGSGSDSSDDDPIYFGTTGGDPGDESQPLRTVNSSRSHSRKSSRSSRTSGRSSSKGGRRGTGSGQRSAAGEEEVGVLPRLVGGSYKTVDGIHRGGSSEIGLGNIVKEPSAREKRRAYWRAAVVNLALIASWYLFSTLISVYNKWMFSAEHYNFSYPLFVTSIHMVVQFILSSLALLVFGRQLVPRRANGSRAQPTLSDWSTKVVPCALATGIDIGLSNLSLKTITLSFYTMCKSSNLAFVLFFAFLFRLETIRLSLIGIIAIITVGVVLMVATETRFVLVGAVEVLTASAMGGLRWALTQLLLDREGMGMNNPIATVFWLSPVMFVVLAGTSCFVEDWYVILGGPFFHGFGRIVKTIGLVTAPGVLAFCMNLSEFALIQRTSVVTLSVAGIFKEVSTIIVASTLFGDELTPINVTGLCITVFGIALYNWLKYRLLTRGVSSSQSGSNWRDAYTHVSMTDDDDDDERPSGRGMGGDVLFDAGAAEGLNAQHGQGPAGSVGSGAGASVAMSEREGAQREIEEMERERERDRMRKREEEADLDGWGTSGVVRTGNGYIEEGDSDED